MILYITLRLGESRWPMKTDGIDASSDHYKDLIAHGWLPESAWTSIEEGEVWPAPGRIRTRLDQALLPIRKWPNPLIDSNF
jgi:hypothetical protein